MDFSLHIEKLTIDDRPDLFRRRIVATIEQELLQLFRDRGVPARALETGGTITLDASTITVSEDANSEAIGRQVAANVYRILCEG